MKPNLGRKNEFIVVVKRSDFAEAYLSPRFLKPKKFFDAAYVGASKRKGERSNSFAQLKSL
jgi:hypothetical protein